MKDFFKKGFVSAALSVLVTAVLSVNAFASDDVFDIDASGNVFGAGQVVAVESKAGSEVENELFAAGMDVNASNVDVNGSAFMAGQTVTLKDATVGGSVFAAGNNVIIDAAAKNNIWAVGNIITLLNDTSVKGLHVAGNTVNVSGEYEAADITGNEVTIDAVIDGDLSVDAEKVIFTDNAKVLGNLKVKAKEDPNAEGVAEGEYTFEQMDESDDNEITIDGDVISKAGKAAAGVLILNKIKRVVLNLFKFALFAVILATVFKKNLADAYEYSTKKPVALWCIGAAMTIFFPILAIICGITIIGLPIAGLTTAFYVLALCFAKVFTFASLVRELIFRRTSKRLHPVAETVLAVLPAAIIKEIPVVGGLVGFACAIYTIGYVCLAIANAMTGDKQPKNSEAEASSEA